MDVDDDSTQVMSFSIQEDIAENLEEVIYLSRLGCVEEALGLYEKALARHKDKHFPVLAEYLNILLANDRSSEVQTTLEGLDISHFRKEEHTLLGRIVQLAILKTSETPMKKPAKNWFDRWSLTINDIYHLDDEADDSFNEVQYQTLEIELCILAQEHKVTSTKWEGYWTTSWEAYWILHRKTNYDDCLHFLVQLERYWEAFLLLKIIVSVSDHDICYHCFEYFLSELDKVVEKETSQVTYLAAQVEFLAYTRRRNLQTTVDVLRLLESCFKNTCKLFEYFFESNDPSDWHGLLAEEWKRNQKVLHEKKMPLHLNKTQASTVLSKV